MHYQYKRVLYFYYITFFMYIVLEVVITKVKEIKKLMIVIEYQYNFLYINIYINQVLNN